jgi:hypothetical protein
MNKYYFGECMISIEEAKKICRIDQQKKLAEELGMTEWIKYLNRDTYIDEKLQVLSLLKLDTLTNQKILDIGAGLGHFGSLCKHYNHSYLGTYFGKTNADLEPFHKDAGIDSVECGLFPRYDKKIPSGPWDCIIILRTTLELNQEWTATDWLELKEECMKNLNPGGQLFIKSNLVIDNTDKYGSLERLCQERIREAFTETPLPLWRYFTFHWIKE